MPSDEPSFSPTLSSNPSSLPTNSPTRKNPCEGLTCSRAGKCEVLSLTKAECKCENTFIQSDNKMDCICPNDTVFQADVNRCFPIMESPSESPTFSATVNSSASPSQEPTVEKKDPCVDDMSGTFTLDIGNTVGCDWILKNKKRSSIRKEKYCSREEVGNMCPASCGACSS